MHLLLRNQYIVSAFIVKSDSNKSKLWLQTNKEQFECGECLIPLSSETGQLTRNVKTKIHQLQFHLFFCMDVKLGVPH